MGRRLCGGPARAGATHGGAEAHQARHGHPPGPGTLRGRTPCPRPHGPPQHRHRPRRRGHGAGPSLLRDGTGPGRAHHHPLRPSSPRARRPHPPLPASLPCRPARPPKGRHPSRPQALQHPRRRTGRRRHPQGHRLRHRQVHRRRRPRRRHLQPLALVPRHARLRQSRAGSGRLRGHAQRPLQPRGPALRAARRNDAHGRRRMAEVRDRDASPQHGRGGPTHAQPTSPTPGPARGRPRRRRPLHHRVSMVLRPLRRPRRRRDEVPRKGSLAALRHGSRSRARPDPIPLGRARPRAGGGDVASVAKMGRTPSRPRRGRIRGGRGMGCRLRVHRHGMATRGHRPSLGIAPARPSRGRRVGGASRGLRGRHEPRRDRPRTKPTGPRARHPRPVHPRPRRAGPAPVGMALAATNGSW